MRLAKGWVLGVCLAAGMGGNASGSGARFVTGPPFFPGTQAVPIGWKQAKLLYSTDPGDLGTAVNHAAADALVAAAAGVWNLPVASITVSQGGALAEHVSSNNVYLDSTGMVWPADVMSANAAAIPIAVIYDTDGSVTDTLLGAGASLPSGCRTNSVTESVDKFDPAGYIVHAVIVINGRCTGAVPAQQLELQYKLERVFGRVLGLAWSQTNDNVFSGTPTPTYNQALNWPVMHPVDIICGLYNYQCLPNPFTLRPDDIASMVLLYPIGQNATPAAGKQHSLQNANGVSGNITFPNGEGMAGVNVLLAREPAYTLTPDGWSEVSAVSGALFRRAGTSPFVAAATDALSSMGTVWQGQPGLFAMAYVPIYDGANYDNLILITEPVNPLYTGGYSLGPYAMGTVAPAGTTPATRTAGSVSAYSTPPVTFAIADAPASCGTGLDGTVDAPVSMAASGWWTATLCGYGHASYLTTHVKPGRSFTVEATALDANGLATTTKAMPVIGVFAPTDKLSSTPSLGFTPAAFEGLAAATTTLSVQTGQLTQVSVAVADQRGDGRPDYPYQGRMFYADQVEPVRVPAAGGTITITGTGFRAGNAVWINGAAATATQWTATTIVAKLPAMGAVGAVSGTAVDVKVTDRGTGAATTIYGGLTYDASAALPNAMVLVSAPAGTLPVGSVAATAMAVRLLADDGVTPVVGERVVFSAAAGTASFGACGAAPCTVVSDATGLASTSVTPLAAGTVSLTATDGTLTQSASFVAQTPAGSMVVTQKPTGSQPVGKQVSTGFVVQVLGPDGKTGAANHQVTFTVPVGSAVYQGCNVSTCTGTTNSAGIVGFNLTPTGAGPVTLQAADGAVMQQISFVATQDVNSMKLIANPAATTQALVSAGVFDVEIVGPDGVTPKSGQNVTFSGSDGILLSVCNLPVCTVASNSGGLVGLQVVPQRAGTFTVQAAYGTQVLTATVVATVATQTIRIVSAPSNNAALRQVASTPFTVQLLNYDGVTPLAGVYLTMAGPMGSVTLNACNSASCMLLTDAKGMASSTVTPLTAGTIPLDATYLPLEAETSFTAVGQADTLSVVIHPASTVYTDVQQTFTVQLLEGDGVTPDSAKIVTFVVTSGNFVWTSCASSCVTTTDAHGMSTARGTAGVAGPVTVTASSGDAAVSISFAAITRPDVLTLVSAPANGAQVGSAAAVSFAVRAFAGDGSTPMAGRSVVLSVASGSAKLGACGAASCAVVTDSTGLASSTVTALAVGTIGLKAVDGAATQTASFTAVDKADVMTLVSAPANGAWVGSAAAVSFAVRVFAGDGVTAAAGRSVVLSVVSGSATLSACGAATCTVVTDATGLASSAVTPLVAGTIGLQAADGGVTQTATFTAVNKADVMTLVSAPANGAWVGEVAANPFAVRVMKADGTTPEVGLAVTLAGPGGVALGACGAASCTVVTDGTGLASSPVTPMVAGTVSLVASSGSLSVSASFTAAVRPDVLTLVSVPNDGALAGDVAATPFAVKVTPGGAGSAGAAVPGRSVTLSVTNANATLSACAGTSCVLTTDANGMVTTGVLPKAAGVVNLLAQDGAVTQAASFVAEGKPDGITVVSVPGDGAWVNEAAANAFAVRVLKADGVTPEVGLAVTLSGGAGVSLGACGAASCMVVTDATGTASSALTPTLAGTLSLRAVAGALSASASFTAVVRPDSLTLVSAPGDGALVGDVAAVPFAVKVSVGGAGSAGGAVQGRSVTLSVTNGNATLVACGAASCTLTTDANGGVQTGVLPKAAGLVGLLAADGPMTQAVTFTAAAKPDVLGIASVPASTVYVGDAATASVRALLADGVTPAAGRMVRFSVSGVAGSLNGCGSPCSATTDANGYVTVSFTASVAGAVNLLATETGTSSNTVNLRWTAIDKPDTMTLVSAPSGSGPVGDAMPVAFAVKVLAGDGTAAVGRSVVFSVTTGQAGLAPCGTAGCTVQTDAAGVASVSVTPLAVGAVQVRASEQGNVLTAAFTATAKADAMLLVSSPGTSVRQGATAATALSVRVVQGDGATPVAGLTVTFGTGGRGTGEVRYGVCGAVMCSVVTGADGVASTTVIGSAAGTVSLVVTPDAASGAQALTLAFEVVANEDSLHAVEAVTYVAEGSALRTSFGVLASANGRPAAGVPVSWTGGSGMVFAGSASTTDANGQATMGVTLGPLTGDAMANGTACGWSQVCATFILQSVTLGDLRVAVVSGGGQAVTNGTTLQPVGVRVTDGAGHGVAAAEVTVYQTVTAWSGACPAEGRCPAAPVLATRVTVAATDADGNVQVPPLVVAGTATSTALAFSVGTQGFATAVVTSTP